MSRNSNPFVNKSIQHANFLAACLMGKLEEVKEFVAKGVDINETDKDGYTALHFAATCKNPLVIDELLAIDEIDIDFLHPLYGMSALHFACKFNNVQIVRKLVEADADVNIKKIGEEQYCTNETPLHSAVEKGSKELLELLLDNHADINAQNCAGKTPLHLAVETSGKKIGLAALLSLGANTTIRDNSSKLPLHYAVDKISLAMLAAAKYADRKSSHDNLADEEFKCAGDINEEYKDLINYIINERMVSLGGFESSSHPAGEVDEVTTRTMQFSATLGSTLPTQAPSLTRLRDTEVVISSSASTQTLGDSSGLTAHNEAQSPVSESALPHANGNLMSSVIDQHNWYVGLSGETV